MILSIGTSPFIWSMYIDRQIYRGKNRFMIMMAREGRGEGERLICAASI